MARVSKLDRLDFIREVGDENNVLLSASRPGLVSAAIVLAASVVSAQTAFTALLAGSQEVPPSASPATGNATFTTDLPNNLSEPWRPFSPSRSTSFSRQGAALIVENGRIRFAKFGDV